MQIPDGSLVLRTFVNSRDTVALMGMLALAAGACTTAAAIWSPERGNSWLLALNGIAACALGLLILLGATRPVAFRTIALFIVMMAMSMGAYEFAMARRMRGDLPGEWLLGAAGVVSVGFAAAFLAFVLRWMKLEPSPSDQTFHWLGSYFGFSAVCMMGLALRPLQPRTAMHRMAGSALPAG